MTAQLVSILVLAVIFLLATTLPVNMGALAFAGAFLVGTLAGGMDGDAIFAGFPGDIFVVLVGVTYLFALARANGTTDWLVAAAVRLVGGRTALIPWVMFAITAVLTAIGAVSPAAVAIVAPVALGFAARHGINPLLMGAMVVHGAQAGGFSPISVYGSIVNGIVERDGIPGNPLVLFLASLVANTAIAAVLHAVLRRRGTAPQEPPPEQAATTKPRLPVVATLTGLVALVLSTLVLDLDVGLTAITLAVLLSIAWPATSRQAVAEITWPTVLLICGVLTYVGVLRELGTIDYAGNAVSDVGIPVLAALLLCYTGAVVSAFASSVGIMGALIPLAVPFLALGTVGPVGMVAALAVSATVVDVSPFSTNGALVLANAKDVDRDRFFKQLLAYGGVVVAVAPLVIWLVLVVPDFG
ncbi:di/tricarboxylate transporter [Saccharothrix coeruleofusca]|uniref:SLC13 family permease n=1 Tax=Saccharothrix coeruleofusca TaxID=33919 RepID=UPI001AE2A274|nr:SLC13 family permease [Saccharothrix coeruleofusca]MBP2337528.1 di/tricarboxylate transporter [Saccharothrix coeruleofusca]